MSELVELGRRYLSMNAAESGADILIKQCLDRIEELERRCDEYARMYGEAAARCVELERALREAKELIKAWHGPVAWDIYDRSSPEMKRINAVLEKGK